ncbi:hypothetical protein [Actinoallomurus vinaceus]|uniref:hypothetical protein n=1 Tax=Actinoallomurus vinaceus TaxID=1080074 RepID=UPI0031E7D24F
MPDPSPRDLAALQAACTGWLIMWSRWRRAYTAFGACTKRPVIIDEADPARLIQQCRAIELAAA